MRHRSYISYGLVAAVLCLCLGAGVLWAGDPGLRETFDRGTRLYEDGKYREALDLYLEAEKLGAHWRLYYNMGNCYFKLGDFLKAKIYFLRAERLNPFDPAIQKNIDVVNKRFNDKIQSPARDYLTRMVLRMESMVSINMVTVVLVLLVFLFNLFLFLLIRKGRTRFLMYAVSFSLVLALLTGFYHLYRVGKHNRRDVAVVVKADAQLRSGPGGNNTVLFKVNPGLKVRIIEKSRNWLQISASREVAGWIEEEKLERI